MMQSPFSPFVGRRALKDFKRRQSEVPSDLIDWDAPEIPELEKQRIIYEELIKECNEDHAIETLINEEILQIAAEVHLDLTNKQHEEKLMKERSQVNLLLGQLKMFENHSQELESHIKELETNSKKLEHQKNLLETNAEELERLKEQLESNIEELKKKATEEEENHRTKMKELEGRVENLDSQYKELEDQYKELEFHNKELESELSCQLDTLLSKKSEAEDLKRKWESARNQLSYYKKLAKGEVK